MAKNEKEAAGAEATAGKATEAKAARQDEPKYTASELSANAMRLFGTRQECVLAALRATGKDSATVTEAGRIVGAFLKKEVR